MAIRRRKIRKRRRTRRKKRKNKEKKQKEKQRKNKKNKKKVEEEEEEEDEDKEEKKNEDKKRRRRRKKKKRRKIRRRKKKKKKKEEKDASTQNATLGVPLHTPQNLLNRFSFWLLRKSGQLTKNPNFVNLGGGSDPILVRSGISPLPKNAQKNTDPQNRHNKTRKDSKKNFTRLNRGLEDASCIYFKGKVVRWGTPNDHTLSCTCPFVCINTRPGKPAPTNQNPRLGGI